MVFDGASKLGLGGWEGRLRRMRRAVPLLMILDGSSKVSACLLVAVAVVAILMVAVVSGLIVSFSASPARSSAVNKEERSTL
ncbi:uncharacterized protein MYCGRDRAFT_106626 [Zymoseptoria tritici IPO323]|uniref:Uncharacterized protein n=1 Tax=Zymoseptoria tritici (strain CBS 115943 / IPO323) TaxID=336722 RepID=F9XR56_ZYMTI|nr:uncharacterized protein MYCGRDRAFT_106626 [Zymoseptoria tritici IPO323]EGP82270.1 hypothetical protein MYCGRDRAFT_106626 [Zymoseptoria tritici IPO323]